MKLLCPWTRAGDGCGGECQFTCRFVSRWTICVARGESTYGGLCVAVVLVDGE